MAAGTAADDGSSDAEIGLAITNDELHKTRSHRADSKGYLYERMSCEEFTTPLRRPSKQLWLIQDPFMKIQQVRCGTSTGLKCETVSVVDGGYESDDEETTWTDVCVLPERVGRGYRAELEGQGYEIGELRVVWKGEEAMALYKTSRVDPRLGSGRSSVSTT